MTALRTFALAIALATVVSVPAGAKPDTPSKRMVAAINDARANHGLAPLREAPRLDRAATGFARHIMRTDSFSHGSSYLGNGFRRTGEALALRRGWALSPRATMRQWLDSSAHRALLLSPSFRYVGTGAARGNFGAAPTTVWVAHFGAH